MYKINAFKKIFSIIFVISFIFTNVSYAGPNFKNQHLRIRSGFKSKGADSLGNRMSGILRGPGEASEAEQGSSDSYTLNDGVTTLIEYRDSEYMNAIGSKGTASLSGLAAYKGIAPGKTVYGFLKANRKSVIAVNLVSYNQVKGHILAAMENDSALIIEVARSQLSYALDEKKTMEYVKQAIEETGCSVPIVIHGDHIQYEEKNFKPYDLLRKEYEKVHGAGSFTKDINIEDIDMSILERVQGQLKEDAINERKAVAGINERLIREGFTSIAIDASTIYDEARGNIVLDYYSRYGSDAEKLVVRLENSFYLPLDYGVEILTLDPKTDRGKERLDQIKKTVREEMLARNRSVKEIDEKIKELSESIFGILVKEATASGLEPRAVIGAYYNIMLEVALATISGTVNNAILETVSDKQKLLFLPTSNTEETAYQLENIGTLLKKYRPDLKGELGIEVEVGHVDKKILNREGKLEAKMSHPAAISVMGVYLMARGLHFDFIACNNGSGHGTEFDSRTLMPESQVMKIKPFLTQELQEEADRYGGSIAQHGTSGSDMDELRELASIGVVKFNIATNYQHIEMNVLSLLDDGLKGQKLLSRIIAEKEALVAGLHEDVRTKMMDIAGKIAEKNFNTEIDEEKDSLFIKHLKLTYQWGLKKGKITEDSGKEKIAAWFAKEHKRAFGQMDKYLLVPRPVIVAGNWKDKIESEEQAIKLLLSIVDKVKKGYKGNTRILVSPPHAYLGAVSSKLKELEESGEVKQGRIILTAQNMDMDAKSTRTGFSPTASQLKDYRVEYVILGHSETRRGPRGGLTGPDNNKSVNLKTKQAIRHGIKPIVCIGETLRERESGETEKVVGRMLEESIKGLSIEELKNITIAYEPVWAIGTDRTATPQQAQEVHAFIRNELNKISKGLGHRIPILYGGSVKPDNIKKLISQPDIDGSLVGGASLIGESFGSIAEVSSSLTENARCI